MIYFRQIFLSEFFVSTYNTKFNNSWIISGSGEAGKKSSKLILKFLHASGMYSIDPNGADCSFTELTPLLTPGWTSPAWKPPGGVKASTAPWAAAWVAASLAAAWAATWVVVSVASETKASAASAVALSSGSPPPRAGADWAASGWTSLGGASSPRARIAWAGFSVVHWPRGLPKVDLKN